MPQLREGHTTLLRRDVHSTTIIIHICKKILKVVTSSRNTVRYTFILVRLVPLALRYRPAKVMTCND